MKLFTAPSVATLALAIDVKRAPSSDVGLIEGLAAGYGNVDLSGEIIAPGAFAASLAEYRKLGRQPAMLLFHDSKRPVGRWDDLRETPKGLYAKGQLALSTPDGALAYDLLREGAVSGLSVGYLIDEQGFDAASNVLLKRLTLLEISLVPVPCNPAASITAVKSIGSVRDLEDVLREAGFSTRKAKAGASAAWRAINEQPDEPAAAAKLAGILRASTMRLQSKGN